MTPAPLPQPAYSGSRRRAPRPPSGPAALRPAIWLRRAACINADPDLFFPDDSRSPAHEAKEWCARCPVQPECLEYALAAGEEFGVWGGLTEKERRNLLRADHAQRRRTRSRIPGPAR
jgi:WhiB family transcriptional regulator, redox-sensing transcriptional regulator